MKSGASKRPQKFDRFKWTPRKLAYLMSVTSVDCVRLKGCPEPLLRIGQKVQAKLVIGDRE